MDTIARIGEAGKIYQPLEYGLVLRQATSADREKLIEFNSTMHNAISGAEVAFLLDGWDHHRPEDFLVVVDQTDRIVSTLGLMQVEWQMGQTVFQLGQPEFVGTLAEYRHRRLVRRQFDILHRWMKERGLAFGLIGGIEYYYRLFGYEYGVDIIRLGLLNAEEHTSKVVMPPGVEVRPIVESDIPALLKLSAERDSQFELTSRSPENRWQWAVQTQHLETVKVENWIALKDGQPIGSARLGGEPDNRFIGLFTGEELAAQALIAAAITRLNPPKLRVSGHPDMPVARYVATIEPKLLRPDAWYIRVNDPVLAFQKLAGEFERRLASSAFSGLTRELELSCYRFNLWLVFEEGKLKQVELRPGQQDPKIGIPPDLLPKLFMGYRDLDELAYIYPDLIAGASEDWQLLKVLFPRLKSFTSFYI